MTAAKGRSALRERRGVPFFGARGSDSSPGATTASPASADGSTLALSSVVAAFSSSAVAIGPKSLPVTQVRSTKMRSVRGKKRNCSVCKNPKKGSARAHASPPGIVASCSYAAARYPICNPTHEETGASEAREEPMAWVMNANLGSESRTALSSGESELPTMSIDE